MSLLVREEELEGCLVLTFDDGSLVIKPLDEPAKEDNRSWWQKLKDWWNDSPVTPYVKVIDMSDPYDERLKDPSDDGSGSLTAVVAGIKVKF